MSAERRNLASLKKKEVIGIGAAFVLALAGMIKLQSEDSPCTGSIEWNGTHKDIAACKTNDHRIFVQAPHTDGRLLPEGVCRFTQIWSSVDDRITFIQYVGDDVDVISSMDLKTGEVTFATSYEIAHNSFGLYYLLTRGTC